MGAMSNSRTLFPTAVCVASVLLLGKAVAAERAPDSVALACKVQLVNSHASEGQQEAVRVKVAGREVALDHTEWPADRLRVYAKDAASVLVAIAYVEGSQHEPRGSGALWRVPCAPDGAPQKVVTIDGADFGHSALARGGRTLFFTGEEGVFALDLRTWKSRRLTRATNPFCAENSVPTRDVVGELSANGALLFDRGCGLGFGWHAQAMRLRNPESARPEAEAAPRPPLAAVAVDASGGIWLSDGWCEDPSTFQRLLHSSDRGQHWQSVPVKRDPKIPAQEQPIRQVIVDGRDAKALLVFTRSCVESGQHTEPAWIYVTEDGGATFRAAGVPPGIPGAAGKWPAAEADPFYAISAQQGSLSDLVLFGQSTEVMGKAIARWESHDRGRTWKSIAAQKMPFEELPVPPSFATFADWKVTIENDGLHLSGPGMTGRPRIYPRR
jgi:hypothetical protein